MKEGWEVKTFEDCIEKIKTKSKIPSSLYQEKGQYPIVSQEKELISGYWDKEDDAHCLGTPVTIFGDHTMVVKYVDFDFVVGADGVKVLQPKKDLSPKFFYYLVRSVDIPSRGYARHYRYLKEKVVKYPSSLPEQERIVSILDAEFAKIDAVKAGAEKSLQHAKDLYDKILIDKFSHKKGWVKSTLQEECYRITDGTHQTPQYYDSGYIFLSSGNVTNRKINWDNIKFVDEGQHQEMQKRVSPQLNDILLAKNGTTGVAAIVDKDVEFDIYVSLALLRTLGRIIPKYLLYFVNSPLAKKQFNKRLKGIGVPNLHLTEIRQVEISYPSEQQVQNDIVKTIEMLDEKFRCFEAIAQRTIALCDDMKQALLRKAFNGEL